MPVLKCFYCTIFCCCLLLPCLLFYWFYRWNMSAEGSDTASYDGWLHDEGQWETKVMLALFVCHKLCGTPYFMSLALCFICFRWRGSMKDKLMRIHTIISKISLMQAVFSLLPTYPKSQFVLRLFYFSLLGEATSWLGELPKGSMKTWAELTDSFLDRFFPPSRMLQLRDEIKTLAKIWPKSWDLAALSEKATSMSQSWSSKKGALLRFLQGTWPNE